MEDDYMRNFMQDFVQDFSQDILKTQEMGEIQEAGASVQVFRSLRQDVETYGDGAGVLQHGARAHGDGAGVWRQGAEAHGSENGRKPLMRMAENSVQMTGILLQERQKPVGGARSSGQDEFLSQLVQAALKARETAYAPYSHYTVGAALLAAGGFLYTGGNIENASYGACNCAERTAIFKAVSEGRKNFLAIAIAGGMEGKEPVDYAYPCGICRQVMQEFAGKDFLVVAAKSTEDFRKYRLEDLMPYGFGGESIK